MVREKLIENDAMVEIDKRSFEEEMEALNVPIERPKAKTAKAVTPWITPRSKGKMDGISVRRTYIGFSARLVEKLSKYGSPKVAIRVVDFEGQPAINFRYDPNGYAINKQAHGTYMIQRGIVIDQYFKSKGVQSGRYEVFKTGDGYLAVWEGE